MSNGVSYIGNQPASGASLNNLPSFGATAPTYNVGIADAGHLIIADATSGVLTINLPPLINVPAGFTISVKKFDSTPNDIIVAANGTDTINSIFSTMNIVNQNDGISYDATADGWLSYAVSSSNAGAGTGGLTSSGGSNSMPNGDFDIGLNNSASLTLSGATLTNSYQYTGAGAAILYGVTASNINGVSEVSIDCAINEFTSSTDFYVAKQIPIPANTSVELLKRPKVIKPSDRVKFQTNTAGGVNLALRYTEFNTNTDLFKVYYNADSGAVSGHTIYTETNTLGSVLDSLLLANTDGTNNVNVTITITDGAASPIIVSSMVLPIGATVELCEIPLVLKNTNTISITVSDANRCHVTIAGRLI